MLLETIPKRLSYLKNLVVGMSSMMDNQEIAATTSSSPSSLIDVRYFEKYISNECLLDCLVVLFDECMSSTLRREKNVSDFLDQCKLFKNLYIELFQQKISLF